jgi:predicted membrane-bound mannosyltransferase
VDKSAVTQAAAAEASALESLMVSEATAVVSAAETQQSIPYNQAPGIDYDQKRADMACSLDNPDACEACGS